MDRRIFLGIISSSLATQRLLAQSSDRLTNDDSTSADMAGMPSGVDKATQKLMVQAVLVNTIYPVLTRGYDNLRSCANTHETVLSPASIRAAGRLNKLFSVTMPGDKRGAEAQPLLVPNVRVSDGTVHDLLIGCSMSNGVFAWDANDGTPLWMSRVGLPVKGSNAIDMWAINDHWGILSTGVIAGQTLYVLAWNSTDGTPQNSQHCLYKINLVNGSIVSCLRLDKSTRTMQRKQRAALSYVTINGKDTIFIPWGTIQETADGAHGYVTAVDVATFTVTAEWSVTPNGKGGGIWQGGQGLLADKDGYLFAMTGNGTYDGVNDFSECFIKLQYTGSSLKIIDHKMVFQDSTRKPGYDDMDLGSGGPGLIPELGYLFGGGKDGILYVLPWRKLNGPYTVAPIWDSFYPGANIPAVPQDMLLANRSHHLHASSPVWKSDDGWRRFSWGENGNLRAWHMDATGAHYLGCSQEVASAQAAVPPGGMPGSMMCLSANGTKDGLLWATVPIGDANRTISQGYLACYDATTFGKYQDGSGSISLLWKSDSFVFNKFNPPVVSGGRVYVADYAANISVYGL